LFSRLAFNLTAVYVEMHLCSFRFCWSSLLTRSTAVCVRRVCYWKRDCLVQKILQTSQSSPFCTNVSSRRLTVLGIETSCDDTGAAVVNDCGEIVGEAIHSQTSIHVE